MKLRYMAVQLFVIGETGSGWAPELAALPDFLESFIQKI
jgi:hypothetical protein